MAIVFDDEKSSGSGKIVFDDQPRGESLMQRAAQVATSPMRAARGMPILINNMMQGNGFPYSLYRAGQSMQSGFQPQGVGENLASIAGESIPLAPLGGALGTGGKVAQLAKAGGLASGLSALNQTAEEGAPTVGRTAVAGALGMAPVAVTQGLKGIFPYVAGKFTKTPSAAYENLTTAFKEQFPGDAQAIDQASGKVAPALSSAKDAINARLKGLRTYMGMDMTTGEALAEAEATGGQPRDSGRIVKEFRQIQKNSAPYTEQKVQSPLLGPTGQPIESTVKIPGIRPGEKLRKLDQFSRDINSTTGGSYTTAELQTKKAIEAEAFKTGGAPYRIFNKFKQQWGKLREIEDDLGKNLADPVSSGAEIEGLVRKTLEKPEKLTGNDERKLDAVRRLESVVGKSIIEPLKNQIKSQYTNNVLSDFVPKGMLGKMLLMKYFPEGMASFIMGSPKAMGAVAQGLNNPAGPVSKAAKSAAPAIINHILASTR